ncbi:nucleotidyltransferase [Methylobacterium sp. J-026]|uniref:nucleotide-binding domain-containing protein n=1 Tax=Methylobacterium sp. J-026 TaxID=2836624 RepID=UPI001FBBC17F|nr:nucleotidyltransferase [Methylobacterium sp. J-026]MCJ2136849.1 nucleotidyltransferase [Methylobacterium sp. J-026]
MSISDAFRTFIGNIKVDNSDTIGLRYEEITGALNQEFRSTDSKVANRLRIGSYGRWTAIKGVSDLDMLYIMPAWRWADYEDGGQYALLKKSADAIRARYPRTPVKVDRLVVQVRYGDFHVEVQPVFEQADGSFKYPDTYGDGAWKITKPRDEIAAMAEFELQKNKNLRRLCRMARAWKNKHGVAMGGLLIDTLSYNFLKQMIEYDCKSYLYYDWMSRDFFKYLSEQPKQDYYAALGSGQRVRVKKDFRSKAKKAYELCLSAIEAEGETYRNERWRRVYGRGFPPRPDSRVAEAVVAMDAYAAPNTEEFIEDRFPVDVRYDIELDCEVTQRGFRPTFLRSMISSRMPLLANKSLRFFVKSSEVPKPYDLYWKVLNRGKQAVKRKCIRGQITRDGGYHERKESSDFMGDHIVECYAVKDGVVVATDRTHVPISTTRD